MKEETTQHLFDEFPPISDKEWETQVIKDLKGADYEKKLVWKTLEGFQVQPFYRAENVPDYSFFDESNSQFPANRWLIRQDFTVENVAETNQKILQAIQNGVTSIGFVFCDSCKIGFEDFNILLKNIDWYKIELNFYLCSTSSNILSLLLELVNQHKMDSLKIRGSVCFDPIGSLLVDGNFCCHSETAAFSSLKSNLEFASLNFPHFEIININAKHFHNSGATIVQELAFSLSSAVEYLDKLSNIGLKISEISSRIQFTFAIGSNYFMEIAKLRAVRFLWKKILESFDKNLVSQKMKIHCETSEMVQSSADQHVNILRATTQSMSAIIGGTHSLAVLPFDFSFSKTSDFSQRIAKNIQIVLKEESYLDKVADVSSGSYYIENLTDLLVNEAWKLFLMIEEKGGFIEALKQNFIQAEIEKIALTRKLNLETRKDILLGVNQYPNHTETIENTKLKFSELREKTQKCETLCKPLNFFRSAEPFEQLRINTQNATKTPKVFLFPFGNLAMQKARVNFSINFFGCAGFEIINNSGFQDIDIGIEKAIESKAEIVVICSSDDEYATTVPHIFNKLHEKTILVLAGFPTNLVESFKAIGLKHFIHLRSNVYESLKEFQKMLNII